MDCISSGISQNGQIYVDERFTYLFHEFDHGVFWHIDHALVTGLINGPLSLLQIVDLSLQKDKNYLVVGLIVQNRSFHYLRPYHRPRPPRQGSSSSWPSSSNKNWVSD